MESNGYCLGIVAAKLPSHIERDEEHDHKIDEQRNSDAYHVQRQLNNDFALKREHDDNGKEKRNQRDGADFGNELLLVPLLALRLQIR